MCRVWLQTGLRRNRSILLSSLRFACSPTKLSIMGQLCLASSKTVCEIAIAKQRLLRKWGGWSATRSSGFVSGVLLTVCCSDVTCLVGPSRTPVAAHRPVLCSRSSVLAALLGVRHIRFCPSFSHSFPCQAGKGHKQLEFPEMGACGCFSNCASIALSHLFVIAEPAVFKLALTAMYTDSVDVNGELSVGCVSFSVCCSSFSQIATCRLYMNSL